MNRAPTYSELLLDPRWQRKRLETFERDGWRCRACNSPHKQLHAHHLFYRKGSAPWEYEDGALVTLCDPCHDNEHRHVEEHWRLLRMQAADAGGVGAIGGIDHIQVLLLAVALSREMGVQEAIAYMKATVENVRADAAADAQDAGREIAVRPKFATFSEESRRWTLEYERAEADE